MAGKKLYRSDSDRMWAGVIGGLAEFFEIDGSLLRLIWVVVTVFTGFVPGLIVYLFAVAIVPKAIEIKNN